MPKSDRISKVPKLCVFYITWMGQTVGSRDGMRVADLPLVQLNSWKRLEERFGWGYRG